MSKKDPKLVVLQFNEYINNQDIQGLSRLMAEDHVFIDSNNDVHQGKMIVVEGWIKFFNLYPDYLNHFLIVESRDNIVLAIGFSTCLYKPLDGPGLWTAIIENDLVNEWHVYLDTSENREKLRLPTKHGPDSLETGR